MSELTREDLNRVHARIDGFERDLAAARERSVELVASANASIGQLNTTLTLIGERLANLNRTVDDLPEPTELPPRPCPFFVQHLQEHKEARNLWLKPLIGHLVSGLIAAAAAALILLHKGRS